jgi:flagellar protein FliS
MKEVGMYPNAARAYQAQQVQGVSKVKQVALLYDRLIASIREAIQAIDDNEIEKRHFANKRAQDIIEALYGAVDTETGGEIAENLQKLYIFALRQLPFLDIRNDPQYGHNVIEVLDPLRESWHELARREAAGMLYDGGPAELGAADKAEAHPSDHHPQKLPDTSGIDLAG